MAPEFSLERYRGKRDRMRTPEPFGTDRGHVSRGHRFVVQQHAARRLHWDFRLEIGGVLVSWAVPRGPAVDPKEKRLAVQTEDHPLEYADFEGIIPPGNYGAGAVIVWDQGFYRTTDGAEPAEALMRGKLDLELQGHKLRGRWVLVRTKRGKGNEWLLFSKRDSRPPPPEPVIAQPASVLSGLTVDDLKRGVGRRDELAKRARAAGATATSVDAGSLSPMLAKTAERAFSRSGWLFEIKFDGVRALAQRERSGQVRLFSRNQREMTDAFPEIANAVAHLPCDTFILDGEIVALDERGVSSFERLQQRLGQTDPRAVARATVEVPILMYCFDLLAAAGYDLRPLPLRLRKELLRTLLPPAGPLRFSDHFEHEGEALFAEASQLGFEGIVAKRAASPYQATRRSGDWLKIKRSHTADLAIVGFVPGKGSRASLGALMLAWRGDGEFAYAGNVGSGLDASTIRSLLARLREATRRTPAFRKTTEDIPRTAVFVEPQLVAEVRYREVLSSGLLRHPVFVRLRDDKEVRDCDRVPAPRAPIETPATKAAPPGSGLQLTNRDKVFWPREGYTKGDLLDYYGHIWPALQPYLRDRPVILTRYPDGIEGKSFFQKNAPDFTPDWVVTRRIEDTDYFVCNDLDSLLYVINLGCIPLHIWSARFPSLDRPDWTILDLDPKGAPFTSVVKVARHIHHLLEPLHMPHVVKTSGQDGLHVLIPLGATMGHDEARMLAELLARVVAEELPDLATIARPLTDRGGRVYVDFLQNGFGKTIAAPFSVRPRPGAPVSTWLEWREVTARLNPARFDIRTVPARVRARPDPGRSLLEASADVTTLLSALARHLR